MEDIQRVPFDFSVNGGLDDLNKLEGILCSGHWSDKALNYEDEHTILLIRLLQTGGIAVYRRGYAQKEDSPEIRRCAGEINAFMNKRYVSQTLLDIAGIFLTHEYDGGKTEYNSLFFPELKAFVRCGGLPPNRLIELLERDGCEAVFLFPDYTPDDGDAFFAFMLVMPKEMLLEELGQMRERTMEAMHEAARRVNEKNSSIIPSVTVWPNGE
jgi:hypothetical protein